MRVSLLIILLVFTTAICAGKSVIRVENGIEFSFVHDKKLLSEKPADHRRSGLTQLYAYVIAEGDRSLVQTRLICRPFFFHGNG